MEFQRFSLGLRFAMTKDAGLTPERVWEILFSRVCKEGLQGLTLFGMWDNTAANEPEPAYICVFSKASMKRAKRLHSSLLSDGILCSYLTAYMPFVQNNWIENCKEPAYLGTIGQDGCVLDGEVRFEPMVFADKASEPARQGKRQQIFIAAEAIGGECPTGDVARHVMRQAIQAFPNARVTPVRICDGGRGTVDTLVAASCGRYLICQQTGVRYGVLPKRTVVLETEQLTDGEVLETLGYIMKDGYRDYLFAAGKRKLQVAFPPEITATVLSNPVPKATYADPGVRYASGVETILEASGFLRRCEAASMVVLATTAKDESCELLGATADTIRYHCDRHKVPFSILARRDETSYIIKPQGVPAMSVQATDVDTAAESLFSRLHEIAASQNQS